MKTGTQLSSPSFMETKFSISIFNNQHFEEVTVIEKEAQERHLFYGIDGIKVSKEDWARRREIAIERDRGHSQDKT